MTLEIHNEIKELGEDIVIKMTFDDKELDIVYDKDFLREKLLNLYNNEIFNKSLETQILTIFNCYKFNKNGSDVCYYRKKYTIKWDKYFSYIIDI